MSIITFADRAEWLADRRAGLGASDVSAALGINPWKSPYALWAEKCGLLPDEDLAAENEAVEWGLRLERNVGEAFAERTERKVQFSEQPMMHVHPQATFLRATLDAVQFRSPSDPGALEIKTTAQWNGADWSNGAVPLYYQTQVQTQLAVCGYDWGSIAVLIGGQRLLYRDIERDNAFIDAMLPHLAHFWHLVETRTPPPVDASQVTSRVLAKLHPDDNGQTIELSEDAVQWHVELEVIKEKIKALEELRALHENQLKAAIGAATYGQMPNGLVYSYKTQERASYVVKESKFRTLRALKKAR